ncbi:hypothetical protein LCGC14_1212880 [marine sediment metagenome]|uniref:Uncharacterized protein n=1 Tax=marine sediment metagenome TaxID=412755 RepID=A0A0F9LHP9_9ZZZZ
MMNALCFLFGHKIKDLYPIRFLDRNRLINRATCERCEEELEVTTEEIQTSRIINTTSALGISPMTREKLEKKG